LTKKVGKPSYRFTRAGALDEIRRKSVEKIRKDIEKKLGLGSKYMSRKTLVQYMEAVDPENIYRRTKSVAFYESAIRDLIHQVMELSRELRDVKKAYAGRELGPGAGGVEGEEGGRRRGRPARGLKARRAPDYHELAFVQLTGSVDDRIEHRRRIVEGDVGTRNGGERGELDGPGKIEVDRAGTLKPDAGGGEDVGE
jgi:hypothetical protein